MSSELPPPRRVVTAHRDEDGVAVVKEDRAHPLKEIAPGLKVTTLWVTNSVPATDNNLNDDGAERPLTKDGGIISPNGTHCNITDLAPGAWTSWHRTNSLDHNIILNGTVILKMEDGERTMKAGEVAIQKGTMHAWYNPGPEWARWVCVLIDAEPAVVNGVPVKAETREAPSS